MKIVVVGSLALDTVETPYGSVENDLGGSAAFFATAASFFSAVRVVGIVGEDFPKAELDFLESRGIDLTGVQRAAGKTFHWHGRYHDDMNQRDTVDLQLNVSAGFRPELPESYRDAAICFLANIDPGLQGGVLDQLTAPKLVGVDTINHWIESARDDFEALLGRTDLITINDEEAQLLSGENNVVKAARKILSMGPTSLLVKRGEYGVIHFSADSVFAVPAFPLEEVRDPTGAGDCFAGAFIGALAESGDLSPTSVKHAIIYGSVVASFAVEDFSLNRLRKLTRADVESRYRQFVTLTQI